MEKAGMKCTPRNLHHVLICLLCLISLNAGGATPGGTIHFLAAQGGVSLQGRFDDFVSNVKFDPLHPDAGSVKVSVDVNSVNTGSNAANELIRSADFFNAAKYPQATFEADDFHAQDDAHFIAKGIFTLKGHSETIPVTFTTGTSLQARWFEGIFTISRTSFKVGEGEWSDTSTLDDDVKIQFKILQ
jgi:polyisoprenoid-binding protein YceI